MSSSELLAFCHGNGHTRVNADEHGVLIHVLADLAERRRLANTKKQKVVLLMLPRGSYKTTIAATDFPMWWLSQFPDDSILLDSETATLSQRTLSEIKQHYESHGLIPHKCPRWNEDSVILPSRKTPRKEGSINAAGVDGVKAGQHYELIIADDLHSQHNSKTSYQVNQVIEHLRLVLSLLNPGGTLFIIGTRWSPDDAYKFVIDSFADEIVIIPAVSTTARNYGSALVNKQSVPPVSADVTLKAYDESGVVDSKAPFLNFPHTLPLEFLEQMQKRQGTYIYSAQYLLWPVASERQMFDPSWLRFYQPTRGAAKPGEPNYDPYLPPVFTDDIARQHYRMIGLVDPAFTDKSSDNKDACDSGIVIATSDHQRNMFVAHAEGSRLDPHELIRRIIELNDEYGVSTWYIEEVSAQKVLRYYLDYLASKEKRIISVLPIKTGGRSKELRILSLQPYFERGKVFLRSDQKKLIDQIKGFPLAHDRDILDALAYAPQTVFDGAAAIAQSKPLHPFSFDAILGAERYQNSGIRPNSMITRRVSPETLASSLNRW